MADGGVDAPGGIALLAHHVELGQPPVVDGVCGFDEFLGPSTGLVLFDPGAKERRVDGDCGGGVEVAVVGGPAECGAQIRQFGGEPGVGLALSGAVPQGQDVVFESGEVAACAARASSAAPLATSCSSAN